ncbi:DUF3683 domain-containing protein, partial [Ralstonia pseudosolanacearum]|uniref:DUF3683 domain-containing protein n=1 Tax=Ralstonia pseudosolanacearum TaxID=1310165 RepID=UPI003CF69B20
MPRATARPWKAGASAACRGKAPDGNVPKLPRGALPAREIRYNYTSFSDREIVIRLLGESAW